MNLPAPQSTGRPFEPLDLSVLDAGDGAVWLSAHSRQGEVHGVPRKKPDFSTLPSVTHPAAWFTRVIGQAQRQHAEALAVGAVLRDLVFGVPEIASLLEQTRGVAAQRGANLLVRLLVAPSEIASWPWELMVDPQRPDRFLALARDAHLVRTARARTYPARQTPIAPPLHLLLVLSSPLRSGASDTEAVFDLYAEKQALLKELQPLVDRGLLLVQVEERPSVERLRSRMARQAHGFHVVHYLGHAQPHGLKLEDPHGRGRLVPSNEFSALLQELPDLRLAVFAGCETARAPASTADVVWPGQLSMTDHCVRDASPAVVGMQAVLPFGAERVFTRFFYQSLTSGRTIAEALRLARLAISTDDHVGRGLLDWSVPSLFVGGTDPGRLIDPSAKSKHVARPHRASLRLDARQSELRFFARQNELRESIDVLSGETRGRLLQIVGGTGVGKSLLLDRAVDELDASVARLLLNGRRLEDATDPLALLCELVNEVARKAERHTAPRGKGTALDWWERIVEELGDLRIAIAIDDADFLHDRSSSPVAEALRIVASRRNGVRIAVASSSTIPVLSRGLVESAVRVIRLQPLAWPEVWQWIRRNLPVLTRYGDSALSPYFADLGANLELWGDLSDAVADRATVVSGDLPDLVQRVAKRVSTLAPTPSAPPLFSATAAPVAGGAERVAGARAAGARAASPTSVSERPETIRPLRVAIAGPYTDGRSAQFSRAITALAASHGVGGRMVLQDAVDASSSLAQLLEVSSPFGDRGQATTAQLLTWSGTVTSLGADVMLLDFGGDRPSRMWTDTVSRLLDRGALVIAAGGNANKPSYPAWCEGVIAVGALEPDGAHTSYSFYDPDTQKPELFATKTVDDSPFELVVPERGLQGTSFAALHVVGAALLVWATDRGLTAGDVRAVLIKSGRPQPDGSKVLNIDGALHRVRQQLVLDALERGPLETGELLAETGIRSELALPLLDELVASSRLLRTVADGREQYESREAVYLAYEELRRDAPSTDSRTTALTLLLRRIGELAMRGRFERGDVREMWNSNSPGRRIAAIGAMRARTELRDFDIVLEGIAISQSAFEQFHALDLARVMFEELLDSERAELLAALTVQRGADGWIRDEHNRAAIADALIARCKGG